MKKLIEIAIEQSKHPIFIITNHFDRGVRDAKIVYANKEFLDRTRFKIKDLVGKSHNILFGKGNKLNLVKKIREMTEQNQVWSGPLIIFGKDKSESIIPFTIIPCHDLSDNILYYACIGDAMESDGDCKVLGSFVDSLFEDGHQFCDYSHKTETGLWKINKKGEIEYSNREAQEIFGLIPGKNLFDSVMKEEVRLIKSMITNTLPQVTIVKTSFKLKKGRKHVWVGCKFWPVTKNDKIVGYAGTIYDISKERDIIKNLKLIKVR